MSRRFRIIFVNRFFRPDQSATSQILGDLAASLAERGFDVHVVCSRQLYDDPEARLAPREELGGVQVHRIATSRFGRMHLAGRALDYASFYAASTWTLLGLAGSGDLIVAKTDPPLISILAAWVARRRQAQLVNWQQDVFPEVASRLGANPLPAWADARLRRWRDGSLRAAHMNVLVGSRMLEYFAARGIAASQLRVIENWADSASIIPKSAADSALRRRLRLADRCVVCYSGNLGRAHEHAALTSAIESFAQDESIAFLFIGGGVKMTALQRHVTRYALRHAQFLPYQPRASLEDSLAAADIHLVSLMPSLEGFIVPSKFYGILAAGRPVIFIGDPDGELARIIRDSRCGVTVEAGRPDQLVDAIRQLQADSAGRQAMGAAARRLLDERFSVQRGIERWLSVIGAVPGAAPGGGTAS